MDAVAGRMAPVLAFRENLMTLQFVHGGVDRDGAPLHFHIRDGRFFGINADNAAAQGAESVDLTGFAWSTAISTWTRVSSATAGIRISR